MFNNYEKQTFSNITGSNYGSIHVVDCNFTKVEQSDLELYDSMIFESKWEYCNFSDALISKNKFGYSSFSQCNICDSKLKKMSFRISHLILYDSLTHQYVAAILRIANFTAPHLRTLILRTATFQTVHSIMLL